MVRKSDAAITVARRFALTTGVLAAALVGAGVLLSIVIARSILTPIAGLTAATSRIAGGDLDATVTVRQHDEIGHLAESFNRMAGRLREVRQSDLGKLLVAQQTAEAAIDSLYDPVLVTGADARVRRLNRAAERLFGSESEAVGRPIDEVVRDGRVALAVTEVLRSRNPVAGEGSAAVVPLAGGRGRTRIPAPIDADVRQRTPPVGRRHAARGHHPLTGDRSAQVGVHRRRVARAPHAVDERPDGDPSPARGHRG